MRHFLFSGLFATGLLTALSLSTAAQPCISITNLPDTLRVCKSSSNQLSPTITLATGATLVSTLWTPAAGLSSPTIPNPVASVGTTSRKYRLDVQAVGPNITTNGNFSAGATGFTTSYNTATGGSFGPLSTEGQYLVTTNANLAHINFTSFGDHTGNAGGQMMVVNGSATANTSIWCQTLTVTPNTDYLFNGWGASAVASSPAVLQFSAGGVNVGPSTTLPLTTALWTQFGGTWNSGTATSVTVCITNLNIAGSGNDFAIDDITVRPVCKAADSIYLRVVDPQTTFTPTIRYGCSEDTVSFVTSNTGADTPSQYLWTFGDGGTSTAKNPTHVYTTQGVYTVKLVVNNLPCKDSSQQLVDVQHPLAASFTQSADSFCQGGTVVFTNTSTTTIRLGIAPKYFWNFGDGGTDTVASPTHIYTRVGTWPVTLVVRDFVPCLDTARDTVVIDSIPFVRFVTSDTSLCEGQAIDFIGEYLTLNSTGINWDFGDGTGRPDQNPVTHGYDAAGVYTVSLTASYRICPDTTVSKEIAIRPFTAINIGPDTSICPTGEPILLTARLSAGADGAQVRWSTGDTASSILVRHHGDYWAIADLAGCTSADSVRIIKDCYLDLPNSFTPNGDRTNDYFWPRQLMSEGLVRFSMRIFNRWGQPVWETTSINGRGWDGKFNGEDQLTGVYIYLVEAEFKNGYREKYQGNVTLLR